MINLKELFEKSKSVSIVENANRDVIITINRKSRFIRKDAEKLLKKLQASTIVPEKITLKFNAPLCSKAKAFLESNKIKIGS